MFTLTLTSDEIKFLNKMLLEQADTVNTNHPSLTLYAKVYEATKGKDIRTI